MGRIDLVVPFAQKQQAKKLGAKWDPEKKVWYIPEDFDPKPFKEWVGQSLQSPIKCPYCNIPAVKRFSYGKGKWFFGCPRYPKCKWKCG